MKTYNHFWMTNDRCDYGFSNSFDIPFLVSSDRPMILGQPFNYTDDDVAHGILYDYYNTHCESRESYTLNKMFSYICENHFYWTMENCILYLSNAIRKEGGVLLSSRELLSGISFCPESASIGKNLVYDIAALTKGNLLTALDSNTYTYLATRIEPYLAFANPLNEPPENRLSIAFVFIWSYKHNKKLNKLMDFFQNTLPKLGLLKDEERLLIQFANMQ